ncbi:hypothetical protein [Clostridium sp.]
MNKKEIVVSLRDMSIEVMDIKSVLEEESEKDLALDIFLAINSLIVILNK